MRPDQQRLLLAGRAQRRRHLLLGVDRPRNRRGGARRGCGRRRDPGRGTRPSGRAASLPAPRRTAARSPSSNSGGEREPRRGEGAVVDALADQLLEVLRGCRCGRNGPPRRGSPSRASSAASQRGSASSSSSLLRWRMRRLVVGDRSRVAGDQRRHQPVEEAAPVACGAGEEPVHRRGEPEHAEIVAHLLDGAGGGAVDPHPAAGLAGAGPGADVGRAIRRLDRRRHRPAVVRAVRRDLLEGRAPEAAAGREQRDGLEQVGLARAVGPDSTRWRGSRSSAAAA